MRIISGSRRGHKLQEFQGDSVRPTTDRVKESIFNLIQEYVPQSVCLDMFAGSGALSLEAISRGAKRAVLIDKDKRSVDIIRKNTQSLGFENQCEIRNEDCFIYAQKTGEKFDIIFLDPPYNTGLLTRSAALIEKRGLLSEGGIMVCETEVGGEEPMIDSLELIRSFSYGKTSILIYRR